jgi:GTPase
MGSQIKTGFVGIVGPTNSGKSTLMNALVGEKVSIVSAKVQTTYHSIRGIKTTKDEQVVFTDTPGFQSFPSVVPRLLNKVADRSARECEMLLWVFDATESRVLSQIEKLSPRIKDLLPAEKSFCVLNKADKMNKLDLLPLIEKIHAMGIFAEIIPISALKKNNLEAIFKIVRPQLHEGEALYPEEQYTDRPMTFLAAELVREQIYRATHQEVPYASWVEIESWENPEEGQRMPTIHATIHVDSSSQKGILIGKQGAMLKRIGQYARKEIERLTGTQIVLKLFVDVQSGWHGDKQRVQSYLELNK